MNIRILRSIAKPIITVVIFLFITGRVNAQTEPAAYKNLLPRFKKFYNAGAADSLYSLFDVKMQAALPPEKTKQMVSQLQAQLGYLQSAVPAESNGLSVSYKATFSKAVVLMLISLNTEGKMQGLFFQPFKEKEVVKTAPGTRELQENLTTSGATLSGSIIMPYFKPSIVFIPELGQATMGTKRYPVPLIIVVGGSGPVDRYGNNGVTLNAWSYRYLANSLGESNRIATFLFDKRMVGKSTSSQKEADLRFTDYVSDLILWVKKLKADNRFSKIIIAGHSEGSLVGILAAEQEKVDGFISLAGAGRPIKEVLKDQLKARNNPANDAKLDSLGKGLTVSAKADDELFRPSVQPYLISWMKFSPAAEIKKLSVPVLIIQGSTDLQVSVKDAGLLKAANEKVVLKIINGMNHVLKEAPAGREQNLATYKNPDLPLQKELVPAIVTFVSSLK